MNHLSINTGNEYTPAQFKMVLMYQLNDHNDELEDADKI
jgi:hypothetical protein